MSSLDNKFFSHTTDEESYHGAKLNLPYSRSLSIARNCVRKRQNKENRRARQMICVHLLLWQSYLSWRAGSSAAESRLGDKISNSAPDIEGILHLCMRS